ncbi:hypothetical protein M5689_003134 [Euphorbia peplus]|nr:hypothetical protein M5689_003134 [Euphorbia peplus]
MNYHELATLKGGKVDPSPVHLTHISPMLEDLFDPEGFVYFCVAENINVGMHELDCPTKAAGATEQRSVVQNEQNIVLASLVRKTSV